jgi:hypothetical protein
MARPYLRKFQIEIEPPVQTKVAGYHVSFDGLTFLRDRVMVEYAVDPTPPALPRFGPKIVRLHVVDNRTAAPYPTCWEDLVWPDLGPERMTTRLERRPPADASLLSISVLPANTDLPSDASDDLLSRHRVTSFDVELPDDHAMLWHEWRHRQPR